MNPTDPKHRHCVVEESRGEETWVGCPACNEGALFPTVQWEAAKNASDRRLAS